jgi:hypothetical protein
MIKNLDELLLYLAGAGNNFKNDGEKEKALVYGTKKLRETLMGRWERVCDTFFEMDVAKSLDDVAAALCKNKLFERIEEGRQFVQTYLNRAQLKYFPMEGCYLYFNIKVEDGKCVMYTTIGKGRI